MSKIIVLTANVKYPSSESYYLSSNSYVIGDNAEGLQEAENDFRSHIEVDGFKIVNMLAYIVSAEQVERVNE
jgi:hypothetical protein